MKLPFPIISMVLTVFLSGCLSQGKNEFNYQNNFCELSPSYSKESNVLCQLKNRYSPTYKLIKIVVPCEELRDYRLGNIKRFSTYRIYLEPLSTQHLPLENLPVHLNDYLPR